MRPVPPSPLNAFTNPERTPLSSGQGFSPPEDLQQSLAGLDHDAMLRRLARETRARLEAEWLLENKSRELFEANEALKKVASSLEGQRLQLNTIFEHAQAGIVLARHDLAISRANKVAIGMFGLAEDYFLDHTVMDLIEGPSQARQWIEDKLHQKDPGPDLSIEAIGVMESGQTFPLEVSVSVIEHQGKSYSVWVFHDITRRKEEEERRSVLEQELSQAQKLEALGTLASGVAHEINTPIQYVSDNTRFLKDAFDSLKDIIHLYERASDDLRQRGIVCDLITAAQDKARSIDLDFLLDEATPSIEQSLQGLEQVATIVKAIKEFSHPGAVEKIPLNINQAILTTLTVSRNQWKYVARVDADLDDYIQTVPALPGDINQVLLNLIVNAADAIQERYHGKALGQIQISTRQQVEGIEIRIQDDGCGIPQDYLRRIYDPFFTTKAVGKGSGQGLAITYNIIVMKHGGQIECHSKVNEGTTFVLRLPRTDQGQVQHHENTGVDSDVLGDDSPDDTILGGGYL